MSTVTVERTRDQDKVAATAIAACLLHLVQLLLPIGVGVYVYDAAHQPTLSQGSYSFQKTPTAKLNSGHRIPLLGLGTYRTSGKETTDAVLAAVQTGYRHLDTAQAYGNEAEIGVALTELFKKGTVQRDDLFITTKLWSNNHARDAVEPSLRESLQKLQLGRRRSPAHSGLQA